MSYFRRCTHRLCVVGDTAGSNHSDLSRQGRSRDTTPVTSGTLSPSFSPMMIKDSNNDDDDDDENKGDLSAMAGSPAFFSPEGKQPNLVDVFSRPLHSYTHTHTRTHTPAVINQTSFAGPPVDIWAVGVTVYNLVYGVLPFVGSSFAEL